MEARTTLRSTGISKGTVAMLIGLLAAFMLGGAGGYVAKTLSLPAAAVSTHIVAGQTGASGTGTAWNYSRRHSGAQIVDGPPATVAPSVSVREPGSRRSGPRLVT